MIKFQTLNFELDLTNKGISLQENSNYFSDSISKSFSMPFSISLTGEVAEKLGLVNINNVSSYANKIYGNVIVDNSFYEGYISINEIEDTIAELTLFYGKEVLAVFDKKLIQLPFPVVLAQGGLPTFAKNQLTKQWPEATHNFVKIFRPKLKEETNYEAFDNYLNNYKFNATTSQWEFPTNSIENVEGVNTALNKNVMCPMPYLLEVLRVGFASEGLEMRGDFVNKKLNKKLVLVPKLFFQQFSESQFSDYSFSDFTFQETINGNTVNVYKRIHTPTDIGSFTLKMRLNMSNAIARYFHLTVKQNGVVLYDAFSENKQVIINETLSINIVNTTIYYDIEVELRLSYQDGSIANYNNFKYEYKEGQLNIFPTTYSLADYLPNITFRDLVNRVKNWQNLRFDYTDNAVYINYLENITDDLIYADKSHLEDPDKKRTLSKQNLFVLKYSGKDDTEIMVDKTGQIYDKTDFVDAETEELTLNVTPLEVKENYGTVTGVYPEEETDIMLTLYDGLIADEPLSVDNIDNVKLNVQDIFLNFWQKWLKFRANSETYKDSFTLPVSEVLNIKQGIFKYNKKHLIKSIRKKRISKKLWEVNTESETF
ncbi:hypothetical protein [Tenacibaculum soleae]|uniref:hypothetical protein n=1 Tax=Tenacibaculum soleae TaxID=447689 RepID=UPI0026E3651A|nr:hypothetical protein [Tenacibaculum soleae]MDO6813837.1 hypothetical protein [Tenacibaculum soleae]